jgi:thioredoxin reductase (NADPH)
MILLRILGVERRRPRHPVLIGVPGEALPHVQHYYTEPYPHYRQNVVVVGGGNSAAESALALLCAGAHVTLVHRSASLKSGIK